MNTVENRFDKVRLLLTFLRFAAAFLLYSMFSESKKGADYMIGYFLSSIRSRCGFTPDMMAAAMGMRRDEYDRLERERRVATRDERALLESMCANLRIAV